MAKPKIAYVVNHVAFFVSHRLPLALGAKQAGFDVALITGQAGSLEMEHTASAQLADESIAHRRAVFSSSGMNPLIEFFGLCQLIWFLWRYKPDVVHCASPKGVLYGGIAARVCRIPHLVLAISGMGYAYTEGNDGGVVRKIIRLIYGTMSRFAFGHPQKHVIVQNQDDYSGVLQRGLAKKSQLTLIPGSGVDLDLYKGCDAFNKQNIVLLPARMLSDKGVSEFVIAVQKIAHLAPDWRFVLAGAAGYDNPTAISELQLNDWVADGRVQWLGHVEDMVPLYRDAAIVCLPSYREGMPKVLLEAAAAACAVVTTDVTGCREAIEVGSTGDLVPVKDSDALADALISLIHDVHRRTSYGNNGRVRAISIFSIQSVVTQTINIYQGVVIND